MHSRDYLYTPPSGSARERDYALVYASLEGDQAAWEAICQESFGYVVNAARQFDYRRLFTQEDYYDIADEAFCKCYEHRSRYQGIGRFRRWVFGYAKNIMRNRGRRQLTIRKNQYLLENILESRAYSHDPLMLLIELERDQCLWTAFYQLSEKDQEIIYRRVFSTHLFRNSPGSFN